MWYQNQQQLLSKDINDSLENFSINVVQVPTAATQHDINGFGIFPMNVVSKPTAATQQRYQWQFWNFFNQCGTSTNSSYST